MVDPFDVKRSEWLKGAPFGGPALDLKAVNRVVIHYIGTAKAPSNSYAWMLNTHNMTMGRSPGYSFMYNCYVDPSGRVFEGRGFQFRNAANKETNLTTFSICVGVDGQSPANPEQVKKIKNIVAEVRSRCAGGTIVGHRDVASTSCPGAGIYGQIKMGLLEPKRPVNPPIVKDPEMLMLEWRPGSATYTAFVWTGTELSWLSDGHASSVLVAGGARKVTVNDQQLSGVIKSSKTVSECPPTLPNAMKALW